MGLMYEKYIYFKVSATNNWCYLFVSTWWPSVSLQSSKRWIVSRNTLSSIWGVIFWTASI